MLSERDLASQIETTDARLDGLYARTSRQMQSTDHAVQLLMHEITKLEDRINEFLKKTQIVANQISDESQHIDTIRKMLEIQYRETIRRVTKNQQLTSDEESAFNSAFGQ